jgi:hypothetical protein
MEEQQIQERERQYREEDEQARKWQREEDERAELLNEKKSQIYFRYLYDLEQYGLILKSWINTPIDHVTLVSYEKEGVLTPDDLARFSMEHSVGDDSMSSYDLGLLVEMYYKDRRRLLKGQPPTYFNMKWDRENWGRLPQHLRQVQYRYNI